MLLLCCCSATADMRWFMCSHSLQQHCVRQCVCVCVCECVRTVCVASSSCLCTRVFVDLLCAGCAQMHRLLMRWNCSAMCLVRMRVRSIALCALYLCVRACILSAARVSCAVRRLACPVCTARVVSFLVVAQWAWYFLLHCDRQQFCKCDIIAEISCWLVSRTVLVFCFCRDASARC